MTLGDLLRQPQLTAAADATTGFYSSNGWVLKAVGLLLSLFFIASTIYFAVKTGWLALRIDRVQDVLLRRNPPKRRALRAWRHVSDHFSAGDENSLRIAIIEADKLLDDTLRIAGFRGENLGERLKKVSSNDLSNLNEVWEAHKLRNRIVHETDFRMNRATAERVLTIYSHALHELGILG